MSTNADSHHHGPIDWPQEEHVGEITAGKLGMWIFLLSDAFSFSGLLLAYGIRRGASDMWRCSEEWGVSGGADAAMPGAHGLRYYHDQLW
mgnify:CR=1 FL=1